MKLKPIRIQHHPGKTIGVLRVSRCHRRVQEEQNKRGWFTYCQSRFRFILNNGIRSLCRRKVIVPLICVINGFAAGLIVSCFLLLPNHLQRLFTSSDTKSFEILGEMSEHSPLEKYHRDEDLVARELARRVRVLCCVMTTPKYHFTRARHVKATWGKRCNTLLFVSSALEPSLPTVAFDVVDTHNNLTSKMREGFKYVHKHHSADYDWVLKTDDDTYVIMENLRYLLYQYNTSEALYFGCRFKKYVKQGYMSGGAGYVLSREAMDRLVYKAFPDKKKCSKVSIDDIYIGCCLENVGVVAVDTRDQYKRGRFFPLDLQDFLQSALPDWYNHYIYYNSSASQGTQKALAA